VSVKEVFSLPAMHHKTVGPLDKESFLRGWKKTYGFGGRPTTHGVLFDDLRFKHTRVHTLAERKAGTALLTLS
jgi:hypothetical protein